MSDEAKKSSKVSPKLSLGVINPNDKVAQLREAFEKDGVRNVPDVGPSIVNPPGGDEAARREKIIDALREVYDPEIPVNIYDLGLIYTIDIDADHNVEVRMTLTAPACPVADKIVADVASRVRGVEGVKSAKVNLVFDPPWTKERMSEAALLELGLL